MENIPLDDILQTVLVFAVSIQGYFNYLMYKDLKKKDKIIEIQNKIIEENELSKGH